MPSSAIALHVFCGLLHCWHSCCLKKHPLNQQDMVRWVVKQSNKRMFRLPLLPDTHWFWHMIVASLETVKQVEGQDNAVTGLTCVMGPQMLPASLCCLVRNTAEGSTQSGKHSIQRTGTAFWVLLYLVILAGRVGDTSLIHAYACQTTLYPWIVHALSYDIFPSMFSC